MNPAFDRRSPRVDRTDVMHMDVKSEVFLRCLQDLDISNHLPYPRHASRGAECRAEFCLEHRPASAQSAAVALFSRRNGRVLASASRCAGE